MSNDCPYRRLGVTPSSTPSEIRAAYRRLALAMHPDKAELSDRPAATVAFQQLTEAYHLLSKQFKPETEPRNDESIFEEPREPNFSPNDGHDPKFFAFYRDYFDKIHRHELYCAYVSNVEAPPAPPPMGDKDSSYDVASEFYEYWLRFSTSVFDLRWADDTTGKRRQYEGTIRLLALTVRSQDTRVIEHEAREAIRKEKEEKRRKENKEKEEGIKSDEIVVGVVVVAAAAALFAVLCLASRN